MVDGPNFDFPFSALAWSLGVDILDFREHFLGRCAGVAYNSYVVVKLSTMKYMFHKSKAEHQLAVADVYSTPQRESLIRVVFERTGPKNGNATLLVWWKFTFQKLKASVPVLDSVSLWNDGSHNAGAQAVEVLDISEGYPFYKLVLGVSHLHLAFGPYKSLTGLTVITSYKASHVGC
ncbi:hypothetical protein P691DRAFT_112099 [Macrolepiota fuliginosa MF-IS2]|uniref:Uncharacterized protein n=1 Tax=Macrolepiota fuliginosa MF-IS2 TaxID=1400762 RepID=A0A9P5XA24_9AGAR|nr:hypothetical protein P691DRAFT_112099 [Macrolepiota fuliginosa MF-IS2]